MRLLGYLLRRNIYAINEQWWLRRDDMPMSFITRIRLAFFIITFRDISQLQYSRMGLRLAIGTQPGTLFEFNTPFSFRLRFWALDRELHAAWAKFQLREIAMSNSPPLRFALNALVDYYYATSNYIMKKMLSFILRHDNIFSVIDISKPITILRRRHLIRYFRRSYYFIANNTTISHAAWDYIAFTTKAVISNACIGFNDIWRQYLGFHISK